MSYTTVLMIETPDRMPDGEVDEIIRSFPAGAHIDYSTHADYGVGDLVVADKKQVLRNFGLVAALKDALFPDTGKEQT